MKKKFLTAIALMFSLSVLVGCNSPKSNENKSEEAPATSVEPCAKHDWGEKEVIKEATCTEEGQTQRTCKVCGAKEDPKTVKALGHEWDDGVITKQATCAVPGEKTFTCTRCGATQKEEIKADHTWGAAVALTVGESDAVVNEFTCTACGKKKLEFAGKQATGRSTISGSLKDDSQFRDYLKLGTNGDSVTFTFPYTAAGKATIYLRGVMDYWHDGQNENQARAGYYAGKNSSDGNFELKVNDAVVDYSWSKGLTYEDLLPGEAQGSYSALNDCKVGECNIVNGPNTIIYKRTESYNLLIKDFVIIFD